MAFYQQLKYQYTMFSHRSLSPSKCNYTLPFARNHSSSFNHNSTHNEIISTQRETDCNL